MSDFPHARLVASRTLTGALPEIWAHRGASANAPENTMEAFTLAAQQGADGIELDVQLSRDGVVVVCHDETVDRTSDGSGPIAGMTLAQLQALDMGAHAPSWQPGCRMPTLAQVLDYVAATDLRVNVELKNGLVPYPGLEAAVEAAVAGSRLAGEAAERLVYSSFNHRSLELLVASGTRVPVGVLHAEAMVRSWEYAKSFGARALHPLWTSVADDEISACHLAGLAVHPWTINDPQVMIRAVKAGADAIITNHPAVALALRDRDAPY